MKITKDYLKQIIKEAIKEQEESAAEYYRNQPKPFDAFFRPGSAKKTSGASGASNKIDKDDVFGVSELVRSYADKVEKPEHRKVLDQAAEILKLLSGVFESLQEGSTSEQLRDNFANSYKAYADVLFLDKAKELRNLKPMPGIRKPLGSREGDVEKVVDSVLDELTGMVRTYVMMNMDRKRLKRRL